MDRISITATKATAILKHQLLQLRTHKRAKKLSRANSMSYRVVVSLARTVFYRQERNRNSERAWKSGRGEVWSVWSVGQGFGALGL